MVEVVRFVCPSDDRVTRRLALIRNLVTEGIDNTSTNEEVVKYMTKQVLHKHLTNVLLLLVNS